MRRLALLGASLLTLASTRAFGQPAPDVVATIMPIHAIAAAVMEGVGEPRLLLKSGASPHVYNLKPSDAMALEGADLILWVGPSLEGFMEKPVATLGRNARRLALSKIPEVDLLDYRRTGMWNEHSHGEAEDTQDHGQADHDAAHVGDHAGEGAMQGHNMHIWLSPDNAATMAWAISFALRDIDPAHGDVYAANADAFAQRIGGLEAEIATQLAPVKDRPFIVFHDAYQYFEDAFGLNAVGSVSVSPERQPSAAQVAALREKIESQGAVCFFAEPQFEPRLVQTLIEGTGARMGTLDPVGVEIEPGPKAYEQLLTSLAGSLAGCLGGPS